MNDSELLEQFLQALRQNPHAVPPPGLDPEMVEFARMLVQQVSSPNTEARRRMWARALAQSRTFSNGYHKELDSMTAITAHPAHAQRPGVRPSLTLLAAALAAVLCIAAFFLIPKGTPNLPALGVSQRQEASATPLATLVPTSTPSPANAQILAVTATPLSSIGMAPALRGGYVYVPVIPFDEALALAGTDFSRVQSIELMYRITLNDGSTVDVHAQPIPEGQTAMSLVLAVFPGAQIIYSSEANYLDTTYEVLVLNNGVNVFLDNAGWQVIFFTFESNVMVPSAMQLVPTVIPVITSTPLPVENAPTIIPPPISSIGVETATPIPMNTDPTAVPPSLVPTLPSASATPSPIP